MRGATYLLLGICLFSLIACGGKKKHYYGDDGLSDISPYVAEGAYSSILKSCARADPGQSCTLADLPALGMEFDTPQIADIMERTLVSHAWMGARFQEVLERMPDDMLYLFGAVTAVVIDADIRPSHYNPRTAAIYLDPDYLWLTDEELAVISTQADFRGSYGSRMSFRPVWRYVNGPDDDVRDLNSIVVDTAQLLFHELAHANDIFPRAHFENVDISQRVEEVTNSLYDQFPSTRLVLRDALKSDVMYRLAGILYRGDNASDSYRRVGAALVASHFEPDSANDDYNYTTQYEDVAMLFEEAMMKAHFNMDRDVGFTNAANSGFCSDYILAWGTRNRLGAEQVKTRAAWVVAELLPEEDYTWLFDSFPDPQPLRTGVSWCDSAPSLPNSQAKSFAEPGSDRRINPRHLRPRGTPQSGI